MKTVLHLASAMCLLSVTAMANDSIYGGYNPASRCDNPAGLENPIGVRKSVCRKMLKGVGIFACIRTADEVGGKGDEPTKVRLCERKKVVVVKEEVKTEPVQTKGHPAEGQAPQQAPQQKPPQAPVPGPAPVPQQTPEQLPAPTPVPESEQIPARIPAPGPGYCESMPVLHDGLDASLIDPLINYPRSNNQYLRNLTIGEYRAACEELAEKGRL